MAASTLLKYLETIGLTYTTYDAILCESSYTVLLPEDNHEARIVIGKFTQGAKFGSKYMHMRLVFDKAEADFVRKKTMEDDTFCRMDSMEAQYSEDVAMTYDTPMWVVSFYATPRGQYHHLRASMLAYEHINLLSMLQRFDVNEIPHVATDSIYLTQESLDKIRDCPLYSNDDVAESGMWRVKDEKIRDWRESIKYHALPSHMSGAHSYSCDYPLATDPITYHRFSYVSGMGGSGKTTCVLNTFKDILVLTHTHRLARDIQKRGAHAQTYHSFFRWQVGKDPVFEAVRLPKIILWDEVCTVPLDMLNKFVDFLNGKCQVIFCGDPAQPPPISGEMPHEWLKTICYHEEVLTDYRAKDQALHTMMLQLRGKTDKEQCKILRTIPVSSLAEWTPKDKILTSKRDIKATLSHALFDLHRNKFPNELVPCLYKPRDTRRQNISIKIPFTDKYLADAVAHDITNLPLHEAEKVIRHPDWYLGYCITVHSSQGLTLTGRLWIIDQRLCWSNLVYTAVSHVEYLSQIKRAWGPKIKYDNTPVEEAKAYVRLKLSHYQENDKKKNRQFNLTDDIYKPGTRCAKCNIPLIYAPGLHQQFSVDRLNNKKGHCWGNV